MTIYKNLNFLQGLAMETQTMATVMEPLMEMKIMETTMVLEMVMSTMEIKMVAKMVSKYIF